MASPSLLDIPIEVFDIIVSYLEPREQRLFCRTSHEICNRLTRPYSTTTIDYNSFEPGDNNLQLDSKQEANRSGCLKSTIVVLCSINPQEHHSVQQRRRREKVKSDDELVTTLLYNTLEDLLSRQQSIRAPVATVFRFIEPENRNMQTEEREYWVSVWKAASRTALLFMHDVFWGRIVLHELDLFYDQPCGLSWTALEKLDLPGYSRGMELHELQLRTLCLNLSPDFPRVEYHAETTRSHFSNQYNGLIELIRKCKSLTTLKLRFCNRPAPHIDDQTYLVDQLTHSYCLRTLKQLELKNLRCDTDHLSLIFDDKNIRDLSLISVTQPQSAWKNILDKIDGLNLINLRLENLATPKWIYFPSGSESNPWGRSTRLLVRRDRRDCDKPVKFNVSEVKVGLETYGKQLYHAEYGAP